MAAALLVLAGALAVGTPPAAAQAQPQPGPPAILVVDLQEALRRSSAMQSIQAELQELRQSYQEEFVALEQEFRAIERELLEQREDADDAALNERRREFELRVAEAQHRVQDRRMALDRAQAEAVEQVRSRMLEIVAEIAEARGAQLVLAKNQVILMDRSLDITQELVARLNERLPRVELTVDRHAPADDAGPDLSLPDIAE